MALLVVSVLLVFAFPFVTTDVVESFGTCSQFFSENQPPVIPGILESSVSQDNNRYKLICQQYKGNYRFATLYDTTNKIAIFSAYKYTKGVPTTRLDIWRTERELNDGQANDDDYRNNNIKMSRGHLFPKLHAPDQDTADSTFTLTNAVPQEEHFNNGNWNKKENDFQTFMNDNCLDNNDNVVAHVVTGAIPGDKKMKNKVNIPSHMWMAFCCYNKNKHSWVTRAYCATNEENSKIAFTEERLSALHTFLNEKLVKNVKLFHDNCK